MASGKVIEFERNEPHKVSEVICVKCGYRWIAVRPVDCKLKTLECKLLGHVGYVIETGEILSDETNVDH